MNQPSVSPNPSNGNMSGRKKMGLLTSIFGSGFAELWQRITQPADTMFTIAVDRYYEGAFQDAADRLRILLKFRKDHAEAWYYLGQSEFKLERDGMAKYAFAQCLRLNQAHQEARFMYSMLAPELPAEQRPRATPITLIYELFEGIALDYDEVNLYELGYQGHEMPRRLLDARLPRNDYRMLDLGCGTGLVGVQMHELADVIIGVDVSESMLDISSMRLDAMQSRVYNDLFQGDVVAYMQQETQQMDIILAQNVLPYLGAPEAFMAEAKRLLIAEGYLTFSIDPLQEGGMDLNRQWGTFEHSEAYIRSVAEANGLTVVEVVPFEKFIGKPALQFLLQAPQASFDASLLGGDTEVSDDNVPNP